MPYNMLEFKIRNEMKRFFITICLLMVAGIVAAQEDSTAQTVVEPTEEALPPTVEVLWDAANTAYINNRYADAEAIYEQILATGETSAKLY